MVDKGEYLYMLEVPAWLVEGLNPFLAEAIAKLSADTHTDNA